MSLRSELQHTLGTLVCRGMAAEQSDRDMTLRSIGQALSLPLSHSPSGRHLAHWRPAYARLRNNGRNNVRTLGHSGSPLAQAGLAPEIDATCVHARYHGGAIAIGTLCPAQNSTPSPPDRASLLATDLYKHARGRETPSSTSLPHTSELNRNNVWRECLLPFLLVGGVSEVTPVTGTHCRFTHVVHCVPRILTLGVWLVLTPSSLTS